MNLFDRDAVRHHNLFYLDASTYKLVVANLLVLNGNIYQLSKSVSLTER
jgi:hypothetical protein